MEIDNLIAEHIMGWKVKETSAGSVCITDDSILEIGKDFSPSNNISDAWQVIKKLNESYTVDIRETKNDGAGCFLYSYLEETESLYPEISAEERTAPLAICVAALRSVMVEVGNGTIDQ